MEKKLGVALKRSKDQKVADLNFVIPLFLKGVKFADITSRLNSMRDYQVSHQSIVKDVQAVLKEWHKERMDMIDSQMTIDLKKIDQLEAVYWESWEKSKQAKVKTVQKERSIFDKKKQQTADNLTNRQSEKHVTEYVGDKQWLDGVQWCIQQRAALLQYKKVTPPGADDDGVAHEIRDVVFMTRSRKNNDQFTEAIEVPEEDGENIQKLIQS